MSSTNVSPGPSRKTTAPSAARRTRTAVTVAAVTIVLAVLVVLTSRWWQPTVEAVPTGGGDLTPTATCPALLPGTSNAAADYAELIRWNDQTYVATSNLAAKTRTAGKLGTQVSTITCSITELTADNGNLVANGPWPNGTSTFLPSGTAVFAVQGVEPRCELGVRDDTPGADDTATKIFVAVQEPDWDPVC